MPDANGGRGSRRRLLRGVVSVAVLAVGELMASPGVGPAEAADTLRGTEIDVPVPLPAPIRGDGDAVPDAPVEGGGSSPAPLPGTTPHQAGSPAGDPGAPSATSGATATSGEGARATSRTRARGRSAPTPAVGGVTPGAAVPVLDVDPGGDATVERLREASVPAARQFSLPLVLGALVLAFLAVQGRLDKRDAKLMVAPITVADDLLPFA